MLQTLPLLHLPMPVPAHQTVCWHRSNYKASPFFDCGTPLVTPCSGIPTTLKTKRRCVSSVGSLKFCVRFIAVVTFKLNISIRIGTTYQFVVNSITFITLVFKNWHIRLLSYRLGV